jgi:hypothetical protein
VCAFISILDAENRPHKIDGGGKERTFLMSRRCFSGVACYRCNGEEYIEVYPAVELKSATGA